jgi:methyltransferase (TIGR00027 family)
MELIDNISDTALWIAAFRAAETARTDAVFRDHLADKLAGKKGHQMVAATPNAKAMAYAMVARTTAIDRLVNDAISLGIDTVINLGAGLDTRPYRLSLPPQLQWIEVDFPHLIQYKEERLKDDLPVCRLERIGADLSQEKERQTLLQQLGGKTTRALVITEGVIGYLTNEAAGELAADLSSVSGFAFWIMDISQGRYRRNRRSRQLNEILKKTPIRFTHPKPIDFFSNYGWRIRTYTGILDETERIGRPFPALFPWTLLLKLFPKTIRRLGNKTYGYALFERRG